MRGHVRGLSHIAFLGLTALSLLISATRAKADDNCGGLDQPCEITGCKYSFAAPTEPPGPQGYPAVVHFHGWSSSPQAVLDNKRFVRDVTSRGYVLISPFGCPRSDAKLTMREQRLSGSHFIPDFVINAAEALDLK